MKRKFYKAKIEIEVVAEEPIDFNDLRDLDYQMTMGDWCGSYRIKYHKKITPKQAAKETERFGSDPDFFQLDKNGNDLTEDDE